MCNGCAIPDLLSGGGMFIQLSKLKIGAIVTPTRTITNSTIKYWKYAKECDDVGGGLMHTLPH